MKGILICPHTRTVTTVKLPRDGVSFARLVDAEYFDVVTLRRPSPRDPGAALYLDDMGMEKEGQRFWSFSPNPERVFAGKGLITAVNEEGDTCDGVADPEQIAPHVVWRDVRFAGFEETTEEDAEIMPGVHGFRLTRVAKFEPTDE